MCVIEFTSIIPLASAIGPKTGNCRLALLMLMMMMMMFPAAFGVFFRFQVTDLDLLGFFFLCHFVLLSRWFGLP